MPQRDPRQERKPEGKPADLRNELTELNNKVSKRNWVFIFTASVALSFWKVFSYSRRKGNASIKT